MQARQIVPITPAPQPKGLFGKKSRYSPEEEGGEEEEETQEGRTSPSPATAATPSRRFFRRMFGKGKEGSPWKSTPSSPAYDDPMVMGKTNDVRLGNMQFYLQEKEAKVRAAWTAFASMELDVHDQLARLCADSVSFKALLATVVEAQEDLMRAIVLGLGPTEATPVVARATTTTTTTATAAAASAIAAVTAAGGDKEIVTPPHVAVTDQVPSASPETLTVTPTMVPREDQVERGDLESARIRLEDRMEIARETGDDTTEED